MNARISAIKDSCPEVPIEREDFEGLWADEAFCKDLIEAIDEDFALEVEASLMFAQCDMKGG